jgi:hypothetical protein
VISVGDEDFSSVTPSHAESGSEQTERAHGSPSISRRCHLRTSLRNGAVHVRASSTNPWTSAWMLPLCDTVSKSESRAN